MTPPPGLRTKRRYAHELYPHPASEIEIRSLDVDLPHRYALFIGHRTNGTGWFTADPAESIRRSIEYVTAAETALLLDALAQGLTGDAAWTWVQEHMDAGDGFELVGERAALHLGDDDWTRIKPYPCGPEPDWHEHHGPPDHNGWRRVTRTDGPEDECPDCTEPDPTYQLPGQLAIPTNGARP